MLLTYRFRVALGRWAAKAVAALLLLAVGATSAFACTLTSSVATNLGTYSPAAVKAKAVPALQSRAGLKCDASVLVLLSGNFIRATFTSRNGFKLLKAGGGSVAYKASADAAGNYAATQGTTIDYTQNNLLNLLGLLGGSSADLPFFVKPDEAVLPAVGVYSDTITIGWNWYLCPGGISLLGLCIGTPDYGAGSSTIEVTLSVTPQNATLSMQSRTTWDPVSGTNAPKALPGSRRLVSMTFANPDIVPLEGNQVSIVVPTPAGARIALDGDGAGQSGAIAAVDGSPASTMSLRYGGPTDATDDVDFSADGGASWSYAPTSATAGAVTHLRARAQGVMAKQSSFTISVPYLVK